MSELKERILRGIEAIVKAKSLGKETMELDLVKGTTDTRGYLN